MRNWARASVVALSFALLPACGAASDEGEAAESTSEGLIVRYLQEARGFTRSSISFRDEFVFAGGDRVFFKDELLDDIEQSGFSLGPASKPQGYWYVSGVAAPAWAASTGKYSFSASVPETWRAAFRTAFSRWSAASGSDCVSFSEGPAGVYGINIGVMGCPLADDGGPSEACASDPKLIVQKGAQHIRLGQIWVDTAFVNESSSDWRIHTAMHEIGHALGFSHPWEGSHLSGTAVNSSGCCSANYFTVMDYYGDTVLSADDVVSLSKRFTKIPNPPRASYCGG